MIPVLTPAEMAEVDRTAGDPVEVLIERAGFAVAAAARRMLGGTYSRKVVVVAGRGNNGGDGRVAARLLSRRGALVSVIDAADLAGGVGGVRGRWGWWRWGRRGEVRWRGPGGGRRLRDRTQSPL